jgi:hypothetical protein
MKVQQAQNIHKQETTMTSKFEAVTEVIATYFDGLFHSDVVKLRQVFSPKAQYVCVTDGELLHRTMEEYFPVVEKRISPASRGEQRTDRIQSIEFAGPVTAFARVNCSIGEKYFTDFLSFVFLDGRWQIMSKVFHHEPLSNANPV